MATLKDVAKRAGVSVSTVSIITNGRQKERKISAETIKKVTAAIKELNYRPNISARNLKYVSKSIPKFVLFWPQDNRILMLSSILSGINQKVEADKFNCQIIVELYTADKLSKQLKHLNQFEVQGIIIGGASEKDMQELKEIQITPPVVLINRSTTRFNSVNVNSLQLAKSSIDLFRKRNINQVLTIGLTNEFKASNSRLRSFIELAGQAGIMIKPQFKLQVNNTFEDGTEVANYYLHLQKPPKNIFVESDIVAIGMVKEFSKHGLKPKIDYSLISIGTLESSRTLYTSPSISLIDVPSRKITAAAVSILEHWDNKPQHCLIEPNILLRETF